MLWEKFSRNIDLIYSSRCVRVISGAIREWKNVEYHLAQDTRNLEMQFPSFRSVFLFRRAQTSEYIVSVLMRAAQIFQQIARRRKSSQQDGHYRCKSQAISSSFFSYHIKMNALLFRKTPGKAQISGRPLYPCVPDEERAFNGVVNQSQSSTIARSTPSSSLCCSSIQDTDYARAFVN